MGLLAIVPLPEILHIFLKHSVWCMLYITTAVYTVACVYLCKLNGLVLLHSTMYSTVSGPSRGTVVVSHSFLFVFAVCKYVTPNMTSPSWCIKPLHTLSWNASEVLIHLFRYATEALDKSFTTVLYCRKFRAQSWLWSPWYSQFHSCNHVWSLRTHAMKGSHNRHVMPHNVTSQIS